MKPDLFVHNKFYNDLIFNYELSRVVNIYKMPDLKVIYNRPVTILDDKVYKYLPKLEPYYKQTIGNGVNPAVTTYYFKEEMYPYHILNSNPRYVLWNKYEYLPICATIVDRIDENKISVFDAINRIIAWAINFDLNESKTIVVFDLDRTLIDDDGKKLIGADEVLAAARERFKLLVIWSHGSPVHVDENVLKFDVKIDLTLNNAVVNDLSAKNLLYLYNWFKNCKFTESWLIDDSLFNYCPEYEKMIIPTTNDISNLLKII